MPNYQNGKIYAIRSPNCEKYYIGSTSQKLCKRMGEHRSTQKLITSKQIIDSGDSYIELIENYPCNNKEELNKREGELIRLHKDNIVNRCIAGRTRKEYYQNNQDKLIEYRKDYRIDNIDKEKKYYQDNKQIINIKRKEKHICECGGKYITANKASHNKSKKHLTFIEMHLKLNQ